MNFMTLGAGADPHDQQAETLDEMSVYLPHEQFQYGAMARSHLAAFNTGVNHLK